MTQEPEKIEEQKLVGEITHYFSNIGVAVIKVLDVIKAGDTIRIVGGEDTDFEQAVDSMEVEHQKVEVANPGDDIGLKVEEKVREGYKVYRV
jgi:translation elongation factor EF-1alpha